MEREVSVQKTGLCFNYCHKGRCGFRNCQFVHDEEERKRNLQLAKASVTTSRSTTSSSKKGGYGLRPDDGLVDVPDPPPGKFPASMRYLLGGESVRTNPYLKEFAAATWLPEMLSAPECASIFGVKGKRLRKELSEAFGLLHACTRALRKLGGESLEGKTTIVDLCCGKGFSSLVLACSLPAARVLAIDANANMDLSHFNLRSNLEFKEMNIESSEAPSQLAAALGSLKSAPGVTLFVGVHLCGMLSVQASRLFAKMPGPAALVLAPCCLDKRLPGVKMRAKRLGVCPHMYWCLCLLMEEVPMGSEYRRELYQDADVLSERNSFIVAVKPGASLSVD